MKNNQEEPFNPELTTPVLFLNRKNERVLSYITKDCRQAQLQVSGSHLQQASFASSDPSVAEVSVDGTVTAVAGGSAKITVEAQGPNGATKELAAWVYVRDETATKTPQHACVPADYPFDYHEAISCSPLPYKSTEFTVPAPAPAIEEAGIRVRDGEGADGVRLVPAVDAARSTDWYLNAFVAGHTLSVAAPDNATVTNILADGTTGAVSRNEQGEYLIKAEAFSAEDTATALEQTIEIEVSGTTYTIHTKPETMPRITSYASSADRLDAGVYTFTLDHYLLRINTERQVVYYRNLRCVSEHAGTELLVKNFRAQDAPEDGRRYYPYFIELDPTQRNVNGGFLLGMFVIMDCDYREIDYVTLLPNDEKGHGEGYVDQHEFRLLGRHHWLALSVTQERVCNIPKSVPTSEGKGTAFVQAGIIQEVEDGKVVGEFNTTDYPVFYETSMEGFDYVSSTDKGVEVRGPVGRQGFSLADGFRDYVHINSICIDPLDGNLIVSMRHQYSVYKIDRKTGRILWTLGGLLDDFNLTKNEQFIGQHCAYLEDSSVTGASSPTLLMLDNHTNYEVNETRIAEMQFDSTESELIAKRYYPCAHLDDLSREIGVREVYDPVRQTMTMPMHWSTHCGSVMRQASGSLVIGWGLHGLYLDVTDVALFPVLTEYDPKADAVDFELFVTRNEHYTSRESNISYRVYKNAW